MRSTFCRSLRTEQSMKRRSSELQNLFGPVLEHGLGFGGELIGQRAVDQAVIERQREIALRADGDGIVDDHRHFLDRSDAQDRHLRLIDDRASQRRCRSCRSW